ncbi:MAG: ParB N-terminal domain-containing protein [Lachnospiraceae bacterium]|nr:ParB N-terminal domain-containing protein [Lachnospiraceae bacterium]
MLEEGIKIEEGIKKDIDMNLIDFYQYNEETFGHNDIEYFAEEMSEEGFSGIIEVYAKADGRYEISSGHRRYLAARANKMKYIPCLVYEDTDPITKAKRAVMKNILNRDMTPLVWARSLDFYDKHVLAVEKDENGKKKYEGRRRDVLAKKFNMSPSTVHRYLSLLKLIPEFSKYTDQKNFPYYNFYSITQLDEDTQRELYGRLINMYPDGDFSAITRTHIEQTINQMLKQKENKRLQDLIKQEESAVKTESQLEKQQDDSKKIDEQQIHYSVELKPMDEFLQESNDGFVQTDFDQYIIDEFESKDSVERVDVDIKNVQLLHYISKIEEFAEHINMLISDEKILDKNEINTCVKLLENIINKLNK